MVAIIYPIQDIIPRNPPTSIKIDNWSTIGLQEDNIRRYASTKNPTIHETKIVIPVAFRLDIALQGFLDLFI